jgi:hypothetical protein
MKKSNHNVTLNANDVEGALANASPAADVQTLRARAADFQRGLLAKGSAERIAALDAAALAALSAKLKRPYDAELIEALRLCERHGNPRVRLWCAQIFANPESAGEVAALIRLGRDRDRDVRDEAVRALAGSSMDTEGLRDALAEAAEASDWESFDLRLLAIEGLATRGDPRGMAAIERVLETDPLELIGEDERLACVCALISAHPHPRYLHRLESWRQRLAGSPDECDEDWIDPVIETIETCQAA